MGYRLNRLDQPVFMAVPKPMLTEFGIHYRLENCEVFIFPDVNQKVRDGKKGLLPRVKTEF